MTTIFRKSKARLKKRKSEAISTPLDMDAWSSATPYLPSVLLDAIRFNPNRQPPWIDPVDGSMILADISGFTRMSEQLAEAGKEGAEWLTGIINQYFARMLDIAKSNGGTNVKFGGDALLLLFRGDDHATRAVATALSMQQATRRFTTFRVGPYRIRLSMTAGVHSGKFWSAVAGSPDRQMQHFILGSDASQVATTQGCATRGELVITDATRNLIEVPCHVESCRNTHRVLSLAKRRFGAANLDKEERPPLESPQAILAYLPPPIVQSIRSGQHIGIEGEHRKVSIAFINLLGINELLQECGPDVLLGELQQYVTTVLRLAEQYGGFLAGNDISTNGIKLIVIFGAPVAHEQDSANALRMALELKQELPQLKIRLSQRIGIHSGFVFAGDIGSQYCRQYTVMGDAVNLSARLMASSTPNQILISRRVAIEAGPQFAVRDLAPISVKGKKEPVSICELEREHHIVTAGGASRPSPLFGRDSEIETFRRVCREVESGESRSIVIVGEAGTGKSRLVQEFQEYLSSCHWIIHRGACYQYMVAKPFAPWVVLLNSFFEIDSADTADARTAQVLARIKQLNPELLELAPLLNPLLGLSIQETDIIRSSNDQTRRRLLFELILRVLQATAKTFPLAIVLEDLHWADSSSLQLIEHLNKNLLSSPFLICATQRPEKERLLDLQPKSTVSFFLNELPADAALQLVQAVLNQPQLPQNVTQAILSKARGNPLFLEEVSRSLRQSGALDQILNAPSIKLAKEMASLDISDRIQTLVMSRIDMLSNIAKEVIRRAAVIGNNFDLPTLGSLFEADSGEIALEAQLKELIRLDLVCQDKETQDTEYRFKHALIQEVAYDSLRYSRRRELHHRIASYIEDSHKDQLELMYEVLVHHYGQSQDAPKMRYFALKAGDKARRVFAHDEAIEYYRRGLATLEGKSVTLSGQRSYFIERIADCNERSGHHKEAAHTFSQALQQWRKTAREPTTWVSIPPDLSEGMPPKVRESALYHKVAVSLERNNDYDLALKRLDSALNVLPSRQPLQSAKIYITKSAALFHKGLCEEAIRWGHKGLALSRRSGDRNSLAYAHNTIANSYTAMGDLKKAIRHRHSAVRLYNELGDFLGQATANNNLGVSYQYLGNQDKALESFKVSLNAAERIGHLTYIAHAHNNIGEVLLVKGRLDEAMSHLEKVVETYDSHGDPAICALALINLSRAYQRQRDYVKAFDSLNHGTKLARRTGARVLLTEALLQEAELQLETGQIESALHHCKRALRETQELGMKLHEARGLHILGRIDIARGLYEQAEANIRQSLAIAKRIHADYEKGVALVCLARLFGTRAGERMMDRNRQHLLKQAERIFRELGADADLSLVLRMQSDLEHI